ncbi:hypothetical protein ROHU_010335 [Labeo rohita]|uniref:CCHC-type domain-containing protein n=1 Tax=Labeo rohita TaxID=84645 RepID=A0A498LV36_LABRO|nr:hypothetical protein ROHU_010335 [Labeo rohita]
MEQLVLDEAKLIAQACHHHPAPYSAAMTALQRQYGQSHQLAQSEVAALMNSPDIKAGDSKAFQSFALNVDLLVGMLTSLEGPHGRELTCRGHVDRLLSKLPKHYRDGFIEHLQLRGRLSTDSLNPYNLHDLTEWLKVKAEAQRLSSKMAQHYHTEKAPAPRRERPATLKPQTRPISVYHGSNQPGKFKEVQPIQTEASTNQQAAKRTKRLCLFCHSEEHYLSQCNEIMEFPPERLIKWIRDGKRCWKCGRSSHNCNECTLRKPCGECGDVHLRVLHRIAEQGPSIMLVTTSSDRIYVTPPSPTRRVYLKVTPVLLWKGEKTIQTYAILDDGAQRSIILPAAVQQLGLQGKKEVMALRTIRHDVTQLEGQSVQFQLSSQSKPNKRYNLDGDDVDVGRECIIKGLCVYLNENPDNLVKEYMAAADAFTSIEETTVGIYILKTQDRSEDFGIVLEGQKVLQGLDNFALAMAMLFGLMYALNLNYPPELKHTFEVLQKIVMELEGCTLSKKAQVLRNRLYE